MAVRSDWGRREPPTYDSARPNEVRDEKGDIEEREEAEPNRELVSTQGKQDPAASDRREHNERIGPEDQDGPPDCRRRTLLAT